MTTAQAVGHAGTASVQAHGSPARSTPTVLQQHASRGNSLTPRGQVRMSALMRTATPQPWMKTAPKNATPASGISAHYMHHKPMEHGNAETAPNTPKKLSPVARLGTATSDGQSDHPKPALPNPDGSATGSKGGIRERAIAELAISVSPSHDPVWRIGGAKGEWQMVESAWKSIVRAARGNLLKWLCEWGAQVNLSCQEHGCNRAPKTRLPVMGTTPTRTAGPVDLGHYLDQKHPDIKVRCNLCTNLARITHIKWSSLQIILWEEDTVLDPTAEFTLPGGLGLRTVTTIRNARTSIGAVLRPLVIRRTADSFKRWAKTKLAGNLLHLENTVYAHKCRKTRCAQEKAHSCNLRLCHTLPRALNAVVNALGLDTNLLADWAHRSNAPSIIRWYSPKPSDTKVGSRGNALSPNVKLQGLKMLIHFPDNGLWN